YGQQCVDLGLIDVIQTSDDYLYDASQSSDIFEVSYEVKKSMADRLGFAMEGALTRSVTRLMGILQSRGKHLV
ncbi:MAG TPA: protease SohB, partial [Gammaproteobacteria bacterium]|nr:protease SohB [Gammaproteobacteria bacterium]